MPDERPEPASPPPGMGSPLVPGPPASVKPPIPDHVFYRLAAVKLLGAALVLAMVAALVAFAIAHR